MSKKIITIFGTGRAVAGEAAYALAYETGRLLAQAGFTVANGGYGGTMLAAAKGAAQPGGEIIGVTCSAFKSSKAQAYIVLPGGTGTLLELAKVWELKNKGFLKADKPIILLGGFWKPLIELIATDDADSSRYVMLADEPKQAVELINDY